MARRGPDSLNAQQPRPPGWDSLLAVSSALQRAGIKHALGGSGLLYCLGFPISPCDWDVLTEADEQAVRHALAGHAMQAFGPSPLYPSAYLLKVAAESSVIEIIGRFAIAAPEGFIRIPTRVWRRHCGVPLSHPADWIVAYRAIAALHSEDTRGDAGKIEMLEQVLRAQRA